MSPLFFIRYLIIFTWNQLPGELYEGKREAEVALEKKVDAKKQKRDKGVQQAVKQQKVEVKTQTKKTKKKVSTSSDDDSSESEKETKVSHTFYFSSNRYGTSF